MKKGRPFIVGKKALSLTSFLKENDMDMEDAQPTPEVGDSMPDNEHAEQMEHSACDRLKEIAERLRGKAPKLAQELASIAEELDRAEAEEGDM